MAILSVLVGAVITGIIGNFLVQRWQMISWREQQRQIGNQAELESLKKLLEEIATKSADRYNAMRKLVGSLAPNSSAPLDDYLMDYQSQIAIWNGSLNSFFVRIRLAVSYAFTLRFENDVHMAFYEAGRAIEQVVRSHRSGAAVSWNDLTEVSTKLRHARVMSYSFMRDLTEIVEARKDEIFFGRRIFYRDGNLQEYSLLDLIKMIFSPRVNEFYIIRPS